VTCEHTNVEVARAVLQREGHIRALDAVYSLTCPFDGEVRRNTRLASTIHTLRAEGLDIQTEAKPGMLADYHLMVEAKPWTLDAVPTVSRWVCDICGETLDDIKGTQPALGGYRSGLCPSITCPSKNGKGNHTVYFKPLISKKEVKRAEPDSGQVPAHQP